MATSFKQFLAEASPYLKRGERRRLKQENLPLIQKHFNNHPLFNVVRWAESAKSESFYAYIEKKNGTPFAASPEGVNFFMSHYTPPNNPFSNRALKIRFSAHRLEPGTFVYEPSHWNWSLSVKFEYAVKSFETFFKALLQTERDYPKLRTPVRDYPKLGIPVIAQR